MKPLPKDDWVLSHRPPRNVLSAERPYAHLVEPERAADGRVVDVATLFLTNRECPFRCVMCDLWKNTLTESVAPGQIPEQIRWALDQLPPAQHVKLYNAGSFFDPNAIPPADYADIARLVAPFERVIVECHPRLVGRRCHEFHELLQECTPLAPRADSSDRSRSERSTLNARLEVAMGLETVHPEVLPRLNKQMTLDDFARASKELRDAGIAVRAFILVGLPFCTATEGMEWAMKSLDFAFDHGVECCTLIPLREGNGLIDELARKGLFGPPDLWMLEQVMLHGLSKRRGRVFVDLWDIDKLSPDDPDRLERIARLTRMNLSQTVENP